MLKSGFTEQIGSIAADIAKVRSFWENMIKILTVETQINQTSFRATDSAQVRRHLEALIE